MSISAREWIKWESDPPQTSPHEPTNTLVLTSPQHRFVDIRILKRRNSDPEIPQLARDAAILPFSHLDWAFAGISSSEFFNNNNTTKSTWTHLIDSRFPDVAQIQDSAFMYPQANGLPTTLEIGAMTNPATGKFEKYEEMWRDFLPSGSRGGGFFEVAVLEVFEDLAETRGMVVRVGGFCQGVVRRGEEFALERWEWGGVKGGWKREVRMGDLWMPCGVAMEREKLVLGGKVRFGEDVWEVVELS